MAGSTWGKRVDRPFKKDETDVHHCLQRRRKEGTNAKMVKRISRTASTTSGSSARSHWWEDLTSKAMTRGKGICLHKSKGLTCEVMLKRER
jgi:hypothetical protein